MKYTLFILIVLGLLAEYFLINRPQILYQDQWMGTAVKVDKMVINKGSYISINRIDPQTKTQSQIGVTDYFPAGVYKNLSVETFSPDGIILNPGDKFVLVLYKDNGDKFFDANLDHTYFEGREMVFK